MCNCNSKRAALNNISDDRDHKGMVKLTLTTSTPRTVHGAVTGRMYIFRHRLDFHWVDRRDVIGFAQMKEFSPA